MKNKRGFTLVEVACSLVILSLVFVGILGVFVVNANNTSAIEGKFLALLLLEEGMSFVETRSFRNVKSIVRESVDGFPDYEREVEVSFFEGNTKLKEVRVTVYWTTANGNELSESISTLITKDNRTLK